MLTRKGILLIGAILSLSLFSCQKERVPNEPKKVLSRYISKSFAINSVSDKEELKAFLTGRAKRNIVRYDNDEFKKDFVDRKWELLKLNYRETKKISPTAVNITYELIYRVEMKTQKAKVTHKKLAYLVQESDQQWRIRDVKNIRELLEYEGDLELEGQN